jgi:aminoglycoside phosphotransferase (APT) family kinase protein
MEEIRAMMCEPTRLTYAVKGRLTLPSEQDIPVFLRFRTSNQEKERIALQLLQQHDPFPAPHFLGSVHVEQGTLLIQSYIDGIDLAELLPEHPEQPPLPRESCSGVSHIAPEELHTAMEGLGLAVRRLHRTPLTQFGHLSGRNPNPHHHNAQLFTLQEVQHALEQCVRSEWIPQEEATSWERWLHRQCEHIGTNETPCLVHADLHTANIRVRLSSSQEGWQFAGLIDFEHAKAWLPEYDLVMLHWQINTIYPNLWNAFLRGYGDNLLSCTERLRLFEMVKLLMILSGHDRETAYGQWARKMITTLSPFSA